MKTAINQSFDSRRFEEQLELMLGMQNSMNALVFSDWAARNLAWHRAIYVEAGEYLEHLGTWKWWKKGTPDFPQANMELVDIWHFALSWYMTNGRSLPDIVSLVRAGLHSVPDGEEVVDEMRHVQVDALVAAAGLGKFDTVAFVKLLAYSGMDFHELFIRYVGKNQLNRFRQANGYKTGTYVKVWNGKEDNVHLDALLAGLALEHVPVAVLPDMLYGSLDQLYRLYTGSARPASTDQVEGASR